MPVEEKDLPVELPKDIDLSKAGNPLENHPTWKYTTCSKTGMKAIRETDTLDTFFDSSWYYSRFCSPDETKKPFDINSANYWLAVDHYIGGIETQSFTSSTLGFFLGHLENQTMTYLKSLLKN